MTQEYPVETLVQMARIPEEAFPRFLHELARIIDFARPMVAAADALGVEFTCPAVWIDDDKNTFKTAISVNGEQVFEASGKLNLDAPA